MVWLPRLVPTNGMSVKLVRPACLSSLSVNVSDVSRLLHNKIFDAWLKKKNKVADPSNLSTKSCVFSFVLSTNVWIELHSNGFSVMHTLHMHMHVHVHTGTQTVPEAILYLQSSCSFRQVWQQLNHLAVIVVADSRYKSLAISYVCLLDLPLSWASLTTVPQTVMQCLARAVEHPM